VAACVRPTRHSERTWSRVGAAEFDATSRTRYNPAMNVDELEAALLKLDPKERARLAERLLRSLETLSAEENAQIWAEEAERRNADMDRQPDRGRAADEVLRDARSRLS